MRALRLCARRPNLPTRGRELSVVTLAPQARPQRWGRAGGEGPYNIAVRQEAQLELREASDILGAVAGPRNVRCAGRLPSAAARIVGRPTRVWPRPTSLPAPDPLAAIRLREACESRPRRSAGWFDSASCRAPRRARPSRRERLVPPRAAGRRARTKAACFPAADSGCPRRVGRPSQRPTRAPAAHHPPAIAQMPPALLNTAAIASCPERTVPSL